MQRYDVGSLALWHHEPESRRPKANVLLVHGIGEHSARHLGTVRALNDAGYAVTRFDLRGAGKSDGARQWCERFLDYVTDVNDVFNWMCRVLPSSSYFLLGHSLGGAIATYFASVRSSSFDGVVLSAPAFRVGGAVSPLKILMGRMVSRLAPSMRVPNLSDHSEISRDPEVVKAYAKDPLSCHFNTVRQGTEILDSLPRMPALAARIACPVLMVHGTHDRLIRIEGSFELLRRFPGEKEMYIVPGGYHEPHNDYGKELWFAHLTRWLDRHLRES